MPLNFETELSKEAVSLALEYIVLGGKSSPDDKDQYFQFDSILKTIFHTTLLENASQVMLPITGVTATTATSERQLVRRQLRRWRSAAWFAHFTVNLDIVGEQICLSGSVLGAGGPPPRRLTCAMWPLSQFSGPRAR